ncbi:hypothetical protein, partial [Gelidibacter salicanalis]|uniref:hypothetical protein n=1 Tax=Gelidibacter salicanalis TaxID=291193 RepID=UPI001F258D8A
ATILLPHFRSGNSEFNRKYPEACRIEFVVLIALTISCSQLKHLIVIGFRVIRNKAVSDCKSLPFDRGGS